MSKTKKLALSILCAAMMLFSAVGLMGFTTQKAFAETSNYFSNEKYTDDDFLLKADGTQSKKRIGSFAEEVKAKRVDGSFPELSEVIPKQYLETEETNATFKYFGKEYGFYVEKTGPQFSVLLIDFTYEFEDVEHTTREYTIKVEPILQQSFIRQTALSSVWWLYPKSAKNAAIIWN